MAISFLESFGHYAIADITAKGWSSVGTFTINATGGPRGGRCLQAANWNQSADLVLTAVASRTVGFRHYATAGQVNKLLITFRDGATTHVDLRFSAGGLLTVTRAAGTLLATGTAVLLENTWYYIEVGVTIADAGGRAKVVVNGVTDIDFTGDTRNSGNASTNSIRLMNGGSTAATVRFADMYVEDSLTFHGDHAVDALFPDGAGNSTQFTPDSGSNYARVNEVEADGDTSYVGSSTSGHKDLYTMGNLPAGAASVKAVQQVISARKTDAGARTGRTLLRTGGTDYEGSDIALSESYVFYRTIRETNPNTAAAWTVAGVNGVETGAKVQA